jgi:hypothetical protein
MMPTEQQALVDLARIRRYADERCEHEIERINQACADLPQSQRQRIVARACRPHRMVEAALTRRLAARLDPTTRRKIFDRTLDPHFLPDDLERAVPRSLRPILLDKKTP